MSDAPTLATGRSCAGCTMCCKLMGVKELAKPSGQWCGNCTVGKGCGIYEARPTECRTFHCAYVLDGSLSEDWAPAHSKMVVSVDPNRIVIQVDPARPGAWRKAPYYDTIRTWAAGAVPRGAQILVFVGAEVTAVLPDGERFLGCVDSSQIILSVRSDRGPRPQFDVIVVEKDDPRAQRALRGAA
jgi:hypothetical protein